MGITVLHITRAVGLNIALLSNNVSWWFIIFKHSATIVFKLVRDITMITSRLNVFVLANCDIPQAMHSSAWALSIAIAKI